VLNESETTEINQKGTNYMMTLLAWLPDRFMVLGIVLIAFGVMVRLIDGRRAASLIGFIVLLMVTGPFIDSLLDALFDLTPWWLLLLFGILLVFALLGALSRLMIGRRATGHMVGTLAADVVRSGCRMLFGLIALPLRLVFGGQRR